MLNARECKELCAGVLNVSMSVSDRADGGSSKINLGWVYRQVELSVACGSIFCDQTRAFTLNPTQCSLVYEVYGLVDLGPYISRHFVRNRPTSLFS